MHSEDHNTNRVNLPCPLPSVEGLYRVREKGEAAHMVRLHRNERQSPLPGGFVNKVSRAIGGSLFTNYPAADELYRVLGEQLELPEDQILLTAGSDAAIKALFHAYIRQGDAVVMLQPSYAMYEVYARLFQAEVRAVTFDRDMKLDYQKLLDCVSSGARLVILANPNQPTGALLEQRLLREVIERAARVPALVALDEAYYPFSDFTALPWLSGFSNLLIIRTFSKAAGLAGLRIGFVAGHREVVENLFKVRSAHDINSIAVLAATLLVNHPEIMADYARQVSQGAEVLTRMANGLGLEALPTYTNFMQIRVGHRCDPSRLVAKLEEKGYLVRSHTGVPCLEDCIRVTLGPPELMMSFGRALQQALEELDEGRRD